MAKIKKSVTMSDIAKQLNVSTVTVSKALSGQKGVSEEVRERIKDLADELGYRAPSDSQKSTSSKGYHIGVIISGRYLADYMSFYWRLYQVLTEQVSDKNCFTLFESLSENMEEEKRLPRLLEERKVDGIIVIGKPGYGYTEFLKKNTKIPLVFVDFYSREMNVDCFISDGFYGTYALTQYLIDRGHRDIAYVGTLHATESITDRYLGYTKALMESGIQMEPDYLIQDRDLASGLRDNYGEFKLPEKMPTAFVCNCDFIASKLINMLENRGLRVPEDISVVGYDNYVIPDLCNVEITTYAVDMIGMAKKAFKSLCNAIEGIPTTGGIHIIEGYLVEKNSVKSLL